MNINQIVIMSQIPNCINLIRDVLDTYDVFQNSEIIEKHIHGINRNIFCVAKEHINLVNKSNNVMSIVCSYFNDYIVNGSIVNGSIVNDSNKGAIMIAHHGILTDVSFETITDKSLKKALNQCLRELLNGEFFLIRQQLSSHVKCFPMRYFNKSNEKIEYDVLPLFSSTLYLNDIFRYVSAYYRYDDINCVMGLESWGFCLGVGLANYLKKPFIPFRSTFELNNEKIYEKSRVLLVSHVYAPNDYLESAIKFIEMHQSILVDYCVLKSNPNPKSNPKSESFKLDSFTEFL